jgi:hypothetical protein
MKKEQPEIPHGMGKVVGCFKRWRNKHPGVRLPIPKSLWILAAEVARENGVVRTAQDSRIGVRQTQAVGGVERRWSQSRGNAADVL